MISYVQNLTEYFRLSAQFYCLILDANGSIIYANPLFDKTFASPHEFANKCTSSFDFASAFNRAITQQFKTSITPVLIETTVTSITGKCAIICWEICPIVDEDGRVENFQAIGINGVAATKNSKTKSIKNSDERFRKLISNLNFGVTVRDANGKALLCNKEALKYAELSEDEFLKTTLPIKNVTFLQEDGSLLPADEHPTIVAIKTKKPVRDVVLGMKKNQTLKWILTNAEPILDHDDSLLHVITTFTDITERKKLEQKLLRKEINRQKLITSATIEGQENERKEIGKELHDNINQILTTTQLYLEIAKATADDATVEMIQLSSKLLGNAINEIRKLSRSLVPPGLGEVGLVESVKDLCDSIKTAQIFAIRFYHKNFQESRLPEKLKLMLFRIIQEQMNNIIKYAEATSILIRLITDSDQIMLVVSDNGKGFDPLTTKRGLGFNNMISRADLFDGKVEIRSAPEQGCSIIVTIPRGKF